MELPFEKTVCRYWKQKRYALHRDEETQEVRLPERMPDIGHVIASWGQMILRGKEWRSGGGITITGGVMAWVLYAPADGSAPQSVESWIPFTMRLDSGHQGPDGVVRTECVLRSIDARNISPRKLMLRAGLGALVQILVPEQAELYGPGELPPDIELLNRTYPMMLTRETGETTFRMEEDLELPAGTPKIRSLVYYCLRPRILEQKVMGGRGVFRGVGDLHLMYFDENDRLGSLDLQIPVAQYMDLDGEYEADARISNLPEVTDLELELTEEGKLRLRASLVSQYIINAVSVIRILEDAYSPCRAVETEYEELVLPAWLQELVEEDTVSCRLPDEATVPVDAIFFPDLPEQTARGGEVTVRTGGAFQTVSQASDGSCTASIQRAQRERVYPSECDTVVFARPMGQLSVTREGNGWRAESKIAMELDCVCTKPLKMVRELTAGECGTPDPERPGVIIRARRENETLWDIAKYCGSTVSAIQRMNKLESEPEENRLLLIPVI